MNVFNSNRLYCRQRHGAMFTSLKKVTVAVFVVYCVLTCYTIYLLFMKNSLIESRGPRRGWSLPEDGEDWNPWGEEFDRDMKNTHTVSTAPRQQQKWSSNQSLDFGKQFHHPKSDASYPVQQNVHSIEIWGKAAVGLYLWEHIFSGKLETKMDGVWSYGFKKFENMKLKFRTGPGVITTKVPTDVRHLVLILNGRNNEKKVFSKMWLDYLPHFHLLENVVLIILGNEQCQNDWLLPYMSINGGLVNVTFLVYDSPLVDNKHFKQWPLGVATYRGFPKIDPKQLDLESPRPYICNFLGTVYPHSSREQLLNVIRQKNLTRHCFVRARYEWQPKESKASLQSYIQSLRLSDLTLSPVGMNSECYRIYEAISFGSVPVIENVMTSGACGHSKAIPASPPLRLLKLLNAPVIYVDDWTQLPEVIDKELKMSQSEKVSRRIRLVQWYESFKQYLREELFSVLRNQIRNSGR